MATSPTTSALGALGDLGRPVAAKASTRAGETAEKSSFSAVFHDAQGSRPEPQQRPDAERAEAPQPRSVDDKPVETRTRPAALSGNKPAAAAATPSSTGKDLPPAGESLPATLDQLLTEIAADTEVSASNSGGASSEDANRADDNADIDSAGVTNPLVAIPGIAAVVPENSVTAAAAALASRSGQVAGDDGQPSAAIGDVTSTQKRETPAASQTLNAALLPGEIATADVLPTDVLSEAAVSAGLLASVKPAVEKPVAETKSAETLGADKTPAAPILPGVTTVAISPGANPAGEQTAADSLGHGLTLEKMQAEKIAGIKTAGDVGNGDKNSAVLTVGDNSVEGAASDTALAGIADKLGETERGSFRDTLKQLDSTLAPSTARSDTAPVATARDSGLRQYLDSSATATKVDVPVGKAGWSDAVAGKVMWMSSQNLSSAEIQMNPADLGPLSVRVSSHQDQTSIYFTSPHASVREALDQSLPRLREMMGNQGIQLQDVGVGGQGSMREQRAFSDSGNGGSSRGRGSRDAEIDAEIGSVTRTTTTVSRPGLLDAYA